MSDKKCQCSAWNKDECQCGAWDSGNQLDNNGNIETLLDEVTNPNGSTYVLTSNILRYWSREKIEVFALHLLGDGNQRRAGECQPNK